MQGLVVPSVRAPALQRAVEITAPLLYGSWRGCTARAAEPVGPLPNTRLKLPAPGCGKNCVCAPRAFLLVSIDVAPADVGAAA